MKRLVVIALVLAACTRRQPMENYPANIVDPAPTLEGQIEAVRRSCEGHGGVRFGVCERDGRAWVWFSRARLTASQAAAYDADSGERVFVEERTWSDVCPASMLPDATRIYGAQPPCTPVLNPACDALDGLREWLSRRAR